MLTLVLSHFGTYFLQTSRLRDFKGRLQDSIRWCLNLEKKPAPTL